MAGIHLDLHLEEEGQVAGIVPAVEGQGLHVYVGGDDLRPTGADARRMVDDHLIPLGEIDAHIFDAVFIVRLHKIYTIFCIPITSPQRLAGVFHVLVDKVYNVAV